MRKKNILEFDPVNATDEQIRAWLFAIIAQELDKPEEHQDIDLISECSECETYLSGSENTLTEAQYLAGLAEIKQRAAGVSKQRKDKPRVWRCFPVLLAAALALIVLSVGTAAAFNGSAAWEFITTGIQQILGMKPGDALEGDKVTLIKGDLVAEYDSVEEALKEEGFEGILYPTVLPEGVFIKKISLVESTEGNYKLTFVFNSTDISYGFTNYKTDDYDVWNQYEQYIVDGITFYITPVNGDEKYQAVWLDSMCEYHMTCSTYDELINIIKSIKRS